LPAEKPARPPDLFQQFPARDRGDPAITDLLEYRLIRVRFQSRENVV
jgi:hypothetical protein